MYKLIKAAFSRQIKNRFWVIAAVIAIADGFMYASAYANTVHFTDGSRLLSSLIFISLCAFRFVYSGTTNSACKNKLIYGYTRTEIFISEYIVTCVYALLMATLTIACALLRSYFMLPELPSKYAIALVMGVVLAWLLMVSIVFVITALVPRKEIAVLLVVLIVWVFCVPVADLEYKINEPEYTFSGEALYFSFEKNDPEFLSENERYLGSPKYEITRVLFEMTPSGQLLRYDSFLSAWERLGKSIEYIEAPFFSIKLMVNHKEFLITAPCFALFSISLCFFGGLAIFRRRKFN